MIVVRRPARLRGRVLRLVPQSTDRHQPLSFNVQEVSIGHRFPIGIALSRDAQLFVTDNQGNYNPVQRTESRSNRHATTVLLTSWIATAQTPPLTDPAVNIPHPWTRSVNGICFLRHTQHNPTARLRPHLKAI